jgi:cellulose synthase/poly-beta-1,6-N-acetylglucosamine synthase-like glycosyltransferase
MEGNVLALSLPVEIFIFLAILLVIQSAAALRDGYRFLRYVRQSLRQPASDFTPHATVIIPCKGIDADFQRNITRFMAQDYPGYQIIFVVAEENDPAHAVLASLLEKAGGGAQNAPRSTRLLVAGHSDVRGEKVHNLVSGAAAVDPASEVLVFADADARPAADWLRSLVAPLADASVTVSTGFRWYLPGPGFVSQLRAAWDTSLATLLGDHESNFAWGGSMALRAADFKQLGIADRYWAHTVSDDYAVTRAVRDAHGRIRFEPRCLVASHEDSSLREFLAWANRQIILTRVYAHRLWVLGLVAYGFYCGTFLLGLVELVLPSTSPLWKAVIATDLMTILILGIAKGQIRTVVARELFPEDRETLSRLGGRYWQLSPLVPWVMLFNFVVAGFTRRIKWRGSEYELPSADEVKVLRRDAV